MLLAVILLVAVASACALDPRIVGGTSVTIDKYPYQVSIHYNGELYCGGSIISKDWILTAAHCVYGKPAKLYKVRIGSSESTGGGKLIEGLLSIVCHELYDEDFYDYDVALIKLPAPLTFTSTVKPVALATKSTSVQAGSMAVVTGWGKTSAISGMSSTLQALTMPLFDQKNCQKIYEYYNTVTEQMLCAGYTTGGKDTCQGDSGGPLVYNGVQIGIVSWGGRCAAPGFPGVFARVSSIRDWITKRASV